MAWAAVAKIAIQCLPAIIEAGKEIFSKKDGDKKTDENEAAAKRQITTEDTIFAGTKTKKAA